MSNALVQKKKKISLYSWFYYFTQMGITSYNVIYGRIEFRTFLI